MPSAHPRPRPTPLLRRRSARIAIAAGAVVLAAAVIAGAVGYRTVSTRAQADGFVCIPSADAADAGTTLHYDDPVPRTARARAAAALRVCGGGRTAGSPVTVEHPVACLLDDGRIAVLANTAGVASPSFCDSVGLRPTSG
jgi:hypothetical protein